MKLNRKQTKLIEEIFAVPTRANIKFADIEKLLISYGAEKYEGSGSRVAFYMQNGFEMGSTQAASAERSKEISDRIAL